VAAVSNPKHFSLLFLSVRVSQELLTKKRKKKEILEKQNKKRIPFSLSFLSVPKMALQPNKTKPKKQRIAHPRWLVLVVVLYSILFCLLKSM
jgi:hypothetical protein